jgi:prepilin-type N-terminal cleavage/methylation domain-containing protein/prepilin-type processing-associated H-X9-DG protein
MPHRRRAFTLIELLVVVGIIVVLVAILVPSLESGAEASKRSKCGSNLSAVGKALNMYVNDDSTGRYPLTHRYYILMGQLGSTPGYDVRNDSADDGNANGIPAVNDARENQDVAGRPLNPYLGATSNGGQVKAAHCPSDKGGQAVLDPNNDRMFGPLDNVFEATGNSYVDAYGSFGGWGGTVHTVRTGINFMFGTEPNQPAQAKPAASKVLVGDAPLHGQNRYSADPRNRWHEPDPTQRKFNILFADSHVEFFEFPKTAMGVPVIETLGATTAGNPSRGFW